MRALRVNIEAAMKACRHIQCNPDLYVDTEVTRALKTVNKYKSDRQKLTNQLNQLPFEEKTLIKLQNKSNFLSKRTKELEEENRLLSLLHTEAPLGELEPSSDIQLLPLVNSLRQKQKNYQKTYASQDKVLKDKHRSYITLEEKCRSLRTFIKVSKEPSLKPLKPLSAGDIQAQETQLALLQAQTKLEEDTLLSHVRTLERANSLKQRKINSLNWRLHEEDLDCRRTIVTLRNIKSRRILAKSLDSRLKVPSKRVSS